MAKMTNTNPETIIKTIRFDKSLAEKIQEMANQNQRDFAKQVRFMITEYIRMKENK